MKKLLPILVLTAALCSCGEPQKAPDTATLPPDGVYIMTGSDPATETASTTVAETTLPETTTEETTVTTEATTVTTEATTVETISETAETTEVPDVYETGDYSYKYKAHSELIELENGVIGASGRISEGSDGFSGAGVVRADGDGPAVTLTVNIPSSGHYNITLRAHADEVSEGRLSCDDLKFSYGIAVGGSDEYESRMLSCIYFTEGEHELTLGGFDYPADLDCVLIESTEAVNELEYGVGNKAVTSDVTRATRHLYRYLAKIYGDYTLSAQTCTPGTNDEIDAIYEALGKYPAIRIGELGGYASGEDSGDIDLAIKWWEDGGLVAYNWYWEIGGSMYLENGFDLDAAVTGLDIASMDGGRLTEKYSDGDISTETLMVVDGIDLVAAELKKLRDEGIPVMLRPLPEASNGVFWWGKDADGYLWLYRLIYDRLTYYHGLRNIIWIWNGQSEEFYPGDKYVDITSADLYYPEGENGAQSGVNFMIRAQEISPKPAAISECSVLPSPEEMKKDNCGWLFCGVFSGEYAVDGGELSQKNMTRTDWDIFYSADNVITRDEIDYE